MTVSDYIYK